MNAISNNIPRHVAVIMDGNGRWARQRGLDRSEGHVEGVKTVRCITEAASDAGVGYLTLYTFSTENWHRPAEEVDALMHLIGMAIERETPDLIRNNVRLTLIGDLGRMPEEALTRLNRCVEATAHCSGLNLCLALSYSARWELGAAMRSIAEDVRAGRIDPAQVDDTLIASRLTTAGMPDPDLLIRTGGEQRISNFLLWQVAYAEIVFSPVYWPDFTKEHFLQALEVYAGRQRRFGLTGDQVKRP